MKTKVDFDGEGRPVSMTIDRSEWLNGDVLEFFHNGSDNNTKHIEPSLYNGRVCRGCCLGLLMACAGVPLEVLRGKIMPRDVEDYLTPPMKEILINLSWEPNPERDYSKPNNYDVQADLSLKNSRFSLDASGINDKEQDGHREEDLYLAFSSQGIRLNFVGDLLSKEEEYGS